MHFRKPTFSVLTKGYIIFVRLRRFCSLYFVCNVNAECWLTLTSLFSFIEHIQRTSAE